MSYIVKNCPALYGIDDGFLCSDNNDEDEKYCADCTDCVIKQVIEKCKEEVNVSKQQGDYTLRYSNLLAEQILQLFDIEEINK